MVAKHIDSDNDHKVRYLLAKIHMVAKRKCHRAFSKKSYLLAKIHMVAKPQTDFIT